MSFRTARDQVKIWIKYLKIQARLCHHGIGRLDDQDENEETDAETEQEQHTSSNLLSAINSELM
jgi:hypothetical protein